MTHMSDTAAVLEQEERFTWPSISETDAIEIGSKLLELAKARDLPVTIEVQRLGRVVFRAAREGTNAENDMYLAGKARIVERFGHSSLYERLRHEADGTTFADATRLPFPEYAPFGGGFPLIIEKTGPIGSVMVSGLAHEDDHALIVEAMDAVRDARNA